MSQNRILVIAVDPVIRSGICNFLVTNGHTVAEASGYETAQYQLRSFRPDAAVFDVSLSNGDASKLLLHMKTTIPGFPVLLLAGQGSTNLDFSALSRENTPALLKPVELPDLHAALLNLLSNHKAHLSSPAPRTKARACLNPFIGTSAAIRELKEVARRVLASDSPILLQGETGTGKGVLANWMHRNGPRANQPLLDLNCAGLSRELLESELFGHEKGAFTSAVSAKPGLLEVAHRGTVFLDEIGDIDLQVQPKLLKVLEDRVFRRLGDVRDRSVDIRLISATHRDLLELVRQKQFRSDLYFRVNIVYLHVPPLRQRVEDIPDLAAELLLDIARNCRRDHIAVAPSAMSALQQHSWPGNVRELRNVLERAALIAQGSLLKSGHLHFQGASAHSARSDSDVMTGTLRQMERAYISHVLHDERGSIERTARRLGIPRSSLYNKMKRFEIPNGTGRLQP